MEGFFLDILVFLETKISNQRGSTILNRLGFDMIELVEGDGFAGGI